MAKRVVDIYTTYVDDRTIIWRDVNKGTEPVSTEIIGWYFGEPTEEDTAYYVGRLKAKYKL